MGFRLVLKSMALNGYERRLCIFGIYGAIQMLLLLLLLLLFRRIR